ncbi:hypothetical protein BJV78DRAFT_1258595 [Lactifluus subvellereus]|nr:hypothetical protein BJV78DRAFT_1258595 [Lactifluus subvellereus]
MAVLSIWLGGHSVRGWVGLLVAHLTSSMSAASERLLCQTNDSTLEHMVLSRNVWAGRPNRRGSDRCILSASIASGGCFSRAQSATLPLVFFYPHRQPDSENRSSSHASQYRFCS